jgi:opacity protein-like surface antigen
VRWNLTSSIGLDVGYRFRGVSDASIEQFESVDLYSNNVVVGLVFSF